MNRATEAYSWRVLGAAQAISTSTSAGFSGRREADVGRIIDPACTNADADGRRGSGLHHPRLS